MFAREQYDAVRAGAGIVTPGDRGLIGVRGADRAAFLQGLLTNDIAALTAGSGCYAAYLTPQGRMIADMRVLETGGLVVLDVAGDLKDGLMARLDQLIFTEDVGLEDLTASLAIVGVHGPASPAMVARLVGASGPAAPDLAAWPEFANARVTRADAAFVIVASRAFGVAGFDALVDPAAGSGIRSALRSAGAVDVDPEIAEILRVESGRPAFGIDMGTDTIPLEAGLDDRAVSFSKGCYVGQEVIVRIMHRGQGRVARRLVGLVVDAGPAPENVPERGAPIEHDGQPIGHVTSAVVSPAVERPIALGYVKREQAEPGATVRVQVRGRPVGATVVQLPFVPSVRE